MKNANSKLKIHPRAAEEGLITSDLLTLTDFDIYRFSALKRPGTSPMQRFNVMKWV